MFLSKTKYCLAYRIQQCKKNRRNNSSRFTKLLTLWTNQRERFVWLFCVAMCTSQRIRTSKSNFWLSKSRKSPKKNVLSLAERRYLPHNEKPDLWNDFSAGMEKSNEVQLSLRLATKLTKVSWKLPYIPMGLRHMWRIRNWIWKWRKKKAVF